ARAHVVGAHVAGGGGAGPLGDAGAEDEEVLVEGARSVRQDVEPGDVAAQTVEEADAPAGSEPRDGLAGRRVEGEEPLAGGEEDAPVAALRPVDDPPVHAESVGGGVR